MVGVGTIAVTDLGFNVSTPAVVMETSFPRPFAFQGINPDLRIVSKITFRAFTQIAKNRRNGVPSMPFDDSVQWTAGLVFCSTWIVSHYVCETFCRCLRIGRGCLIRHFIKDLHLIVGPQQTHGIDTLSGCEQNVDAK